MHVRNGLRGLRLLDEQQRLDQQCQYQHELHDFQRQFGGLFIDNDNDDSFYRCAVGFVFRFVCIEICYVRCRIQHRNDDFEYFELGKCGGGRRQHHGELQVER